MVLAPAELREVRGQRFSIADFCSALVSQVSLLAPRCCVGDQGLLSRVKRTLAPGEPGMVLAPVELSDEVVDRRRRIILAH